MTLRLPIDTYSPDQLSALVLELQDLIAAARDRAVRRDATPPDTSPNLAALLQENNVAYNDIPALQAITRDATTLIDTTPSIHILLAAMPGRVIKRQIVTWFRTQISPQALLTFAVRSDLGGGAIIQAGSHLYDLSFRRGIVEHKARLTEIARV